MHPVFSRGEQRDMLFRATRVKIHRRERFYGEICIVALFDVCIHTFNRYLIFVLYYYEVESGARIEEEKEMEREKRDR